MIKHPFALALAAILAVTHTLPAADAIPPEPLMRARAAAKAGDFATAITVLEGEAAKGNAEAANALGEIHYAGRGVKASATEAARWFQKAADASYPLGMLNLGTLLAKGAEGVPADPDKSRFLMQAAAEEGFAPAQYALGRTAENTGGEKADLAGARSWYEKAAAQDNPDALLALSRFLDQGLAGPRDATKAFEKCRRAADLGSVVAMNEMGVRYQKGLGVPADPTAGIGWFTVASQNGLPAAYVNLGNCYEVGKGVLQDLDKAGALYAAAAKMKFGPAQYLLAQLFEQGRGTAANPVYAFVNYSLAATNGVESAVKRRDEIKAKLTAEQLQEAAKLLSPAPPASADKPK